MLMGYTLRYKTATYQIFRRTGLGFSEELQVIITGDVVQQRLSCVAICLPVLLRCKWKRNKEIRHCVTNCRNKPMVRIW